MALCGIGLSPGFESFEAVCAGGNLSTRLIRPSLMHAVGKTAEWKRRPGLGVLRSSSLKFEENVGRDSAVPVEEESGHVIKFKMSDFKVLDRVSVGLGGKAGEVVYEAIVSDTNSPLYSTQVVLRRLTSVRAQHRGRRAIEVLKKLVRRRLLYHSYSITQCKFMVIFLQLQVVVTAHSLWSTGHWLQQSDWLPTLEATLALDKESVRKVGDDTVGGPAVSRQLRMIRLLMRDLLIGFNYLHSHGLAHTELRLENVHISPVDRHIKVGILGNTADFYEDSPNGGTMDANMDRRQMMIAFDMRCLGFMMAKMVLQELMDPSIFSKFKSFLTKGNDPSCLHEFLLQILHMNSSSGNAGLQILDRNWGAGWHLLSLLLATKPSKRISCLDALTHPFLCGPRWRVVQSIDIIRWGLGSTALRISEEYIYGRPQRNRLSHFFELMEMLNPHSRPKNWLELLPGKWRILYSTGRHIGLTFRQPLERVLIGNVHLTVSRVSKLNTNLSFTSDIGFRVMVGQNWPHDKTGVDGKLQVNSIFKLKAGRRLYLKEEKNTTGTVSFGPSKTHNAFPQKLTGRKWRKAPFKEFPSSLSVAKLISSEIDNVTMSLGHPLSTSVDSARNVLQEVRTQVPTEMFDLSKLVCGTYVDSRLLVIRGVNGSALLFTRSCFDEKCK
ncbi:hypothetical protein ACLB2K_070929 [Fragaria x ananassa]